MIIRGHSVGLEDIELARYSSRKKKKKQGTSYPGNVLENNSNISICRKSVVPEASKVWFSEVPLLLTNKSSPIVASL